MSEAAIYHQLVFFAEASPARTCPTPEDARALLESAPGSGLSFAVFLKRLDLSGWSSKTSPAYSAQTMDGTLPSSFRGWSNSGMAFAGGYLTLSTSEWPSDADVCSLSDILETDVPPKYFLSARAARGILQRAERRGKELPPLLKQQLQAVATAGHRRPLVVS